MHVEFVGLAFLKCDLALKDLHVIKLSEGWVVCV